MFRYGSSGYRIRTVSSCSCSLFLYQVKVKFETSESTSQKNSIISFSNTSVQPWVSFRTGLGRSGKCTSRRDLRSLEISGALKAEPFVKDVWLTRNLQSYCVTLLCVERFFASPSLAAILSAVGMIYSRYSVDTVGSRNFCSIMKPQKVPFRG